MQHEAMARVGAGTWRVYSVALAMQQQTGCWPEPDAIRRLAEAEGADVGAALVLTRFVLPADEAPDVYVPLSEPRGRYSTARCSSAATVWALILRDQPILPYLRAPWGPHIPRNRLEDWARAWTRNEERSHADRGEQRRSFASPRDASVSA